MNIALNFKSNKSKNPVLEYMLSIVQVRYTQKSENMVFWLKRVKHRRISPREPITNSLDKT